MEWRLTLIGFVLVVVSATGQQPPSGQFTFRTEITMVEVVALVTRDDGRSVSDLTAADFEVLEDGEPRSLASVRRLTTTRITRAEPSPQRSGTRRWSGWRPMSAWQTPLRSCWCSTT